MVPCPSCQGQVYFESWPNPVRQSYTITICCVKCGRRVAKNISHEVLITEQAIIVNRDLKRQFYALEDDCDRIWQECTD